MRRGARSLTVLVSIVAIALIAVFAAGAGAKTKGKHHKGKPDSGVAYVRVDRIVGSTQYAAGVTQDKLFHSTATTYQAKVVPGNTGTVKVSAKKVTLYTATGSLIGSATVTDNITTGQLSNGKITLTKGTGGQKGHTLKGVVTGNYNSGTQVFTFKYKGTYR
jgi:hypothetical protein